MPALFQKECRGGFPSWDGRCPMREIKTSAGAETTKDEGKSGDTAATLLPGTGGTRSAGSGDHRRPDRDITMVIIRDNLKVTRRSQGLGWTDTAPVFKTEERGITEQSAQLRYLGR